MNSRIYECHVMHARFIPKPHRFAYRIFMLAIDLDELPALHRHLKLLSVNRANLYAFRENDYLPTSEPIHNQSEKSVCNLISYKPVDSSVVPSPVATPLLSAGLSLKGRVLAYLAVHGVDLGPGGRIELITLPRVFGYLFNPVSFYYCYDASGTCVAAISEVTNTFREMKPYFLGPETFRASASTGHSGAFHLRIPKNFYVSPFSDVDVAFDFNLRPPSEKLTIQIDDYAGTQRTLTSTLTGPARPLTDSRLAWFTLKYPLITLRIIGLIHWHALLLYFKKIPWFNKAARAADQRDLYRPHGSVSHRQSDSPTP
ncbi:DUF1365 domain-containing protein [Rariglobus hedericola]|uniref:DUF1365 domain-containing protein n=1 Tax=Rariglobus hedericola TaxID=2597822 RepID=A0A556QGI7_9BACT|nr:DUF1365 domain-containing protein [Rariglobus hedericola]TSJ75744.1 DUF1365 domain-containing protein [Rariglobus hedericola]